jgi:transcriptional regulator with XRE-family HTH domain
MSKSRISLGDQIRRAVEAFPMSRNALCKQAGIDKAALSRFMAGKTGLTLASLEALMGVLGLRLVSDKTRKAR